MRMPKCAPEPVQDQGTLHKECTGGARRKPLEGETAERMKQAGEEDPPERMRRGRNPPERTGWGETRLRGGKEGKGGRTSEGRPAKEKKSG